MKDYIHPQIIDRKNGYLIESSFFLWSYLSHVRADSKKTQNVEKVRAKKLLFGHKRSVESEMVA